MLEPSEVFKVILNTPSGPDGPPGEMREKSFPVASDTNDSDFEPLPPEKCDISSDMDVASPELALKRFYIERLRVELRERQKRHPRFSLRAFAYFLKIDPSTLSRILAGKQTLSPRTANRIIKLLGLSACDTERFQSSIVEEIGTRARRNFVSPSPSSSVDTDPILETEPALRREMMIQGRHLKAATRSLREFAESFQERFGSDSGGTPFELLLQEKAWSSHPDSSRLADETSPPSLTTPTLSRRSSRWTKA